MKITPTFLNADGETLAVCMRDSGYEIVYSDGYIEQDINVNDGLVRLGPRRHVHRTDQVVAEFGGPADDEMVAEHAAIPDPARPDRSGWRCATCGHPIEQHGDEWRHADVKHFAESADGQAAVAALYDAYGDEWRHADVKHFAESADGQAAAAALYDAWAILCNVREPQSEEWMDAFHRWGVEHGFRDKYADPWKPSIDYDGDARARIQQAIQQAIGTGSVCWENPGGAGVFDERKAIWVANGLADYLFDIEGI